MVLEDDETLIDGAAIIDHIDEVYGRARALVPAAGPDRRVVLKGTALMMGARDKGLRAVYERNLPPPTSCTSPGSTTAWRKRRMHWPPSRRRCPQARPISCTER